MKYKVERLGVAGTLACQFEHSGGTGCTICPECGFDELYTKDNVPLTEEGLISCIEEFVRMKEEKQ